MTASLKETLISKYSKHSEIVINRQKLLVSDSDIIWLMSKSIKNESHQIHIDYKSTSTLSDEAKVKGLTPYISLGIEDHIANSGQKFYQIPLSDLLNFAVPNQKDTPSRYIIHLSNTKNYESKQNILDRYLINEVTKSGVNIHIENSAYIDKKTYSQIENRRGQPVFRNNLIDIYKGQCAITDCTTISALEAAHVVPYSETNSLSQDQGVLLRADIHTLFDLYLISINPVTGVVQVDSSCCDYYKSYSGKKVKTLPNLDALHIHYTRFVEQKN
ncbi:HNH endonuclease [Colwellia sp. BRX9-1]|jgi:hypothetical protein|uniref:HNH endonuclease n=1 Tax=Colwellia sp. BRX9-1 TaxID=2759830 RepID=UPI0015F6A1F2|nr:HNH endonuclease signature motif containing protein [Colwellia sp. BRX9-1]MBA6352505.1 HNH endonuclease [Colwellia sp. BRX9-1]